MSDVEKKKTSAVRSVSVQTFYEMVTVDSESMLLLKQEEKYAVRD